MSAWRGMILDGIARVIVRAVNPSGKTQFFKIEDEAPTDDDERDIHEIESFQHFGFASNPPVGSEAITVNVSADGGQSTVIATQHKDYQPRDLAEGEVALFTKDGIRVHCKADGIVYVGTEPEDFAANATLVDAEFARIWDMLSNWTPLAYDGGAALKTLASSAGPLVETVACTQLKAK